MYKQHIKVRPLCLLLFNFIFIKSNYCVVLISCKNICFIIFSDDKYCKNKVLKIYIFLLLITYKYLLLVIQCSVPMCSRTRIFVIIYYV